MIFKYLAKMALVVCGLLVLAMGVVMYLKAGLGVDAFTVFYEGVAKTLNISIGRSLQVCLIALVIVVALIDRTRLGIGTLMHAVLVGFFIDIIMEFDIPTPSSKFIAVLVLMFAVCLTGTGLAMYIKAGLGVGAIDAIMIITYKKLKKDIKWVRIGIDFVLAIIGFALGGTLGIGTAFGVLFTGPVIETMLKLFSSFTSKAMNEKTQLV